MQPASLPIRSICATDDNPYSSGDVRLAFGQDPTGRIVHVSEVKSGLACTCTCPACETRLVAHRARLKAHHFQHHKARECRTGPETALHKFAKQVLDEQRRIRIPEIRVEHEGHSSLKSPARDYTFDGAVLEDRLRLDGVVPDVILRKADRDLLIEIAVTHRCGAEKIARIREFGLSAIEVDLSKMPHSAPKHEIEAAILRTAPRKWLHNHRLDEALAELKAKLVRDAERRINHFLKPIERARLALPPKATPVQREIIARVKSDGYGASLNVLIEGDYCFASDRAYWQAEIVSSFVLALAKSEAWRPGFHTKDVYKHLQGRRLIRPDLDIFMDEDTEATIRDHIPDFQRPYRVVEAYLKHLQQSRLIEERGHVWALANKIEREWKERRRHAEEERIRAEERADRHTQTIDRLQTILARVPGEERSEFDLKAWYTEERPDLGMSIRQCVDEGEALYRQLRSAIGRIEGMFSRYGDMPEDLLGLPLAKERSRRIAARRAEEEAKERLAEQERAAVAAARVTRLEANASGLLLSKTSDWLKTGCAELGGRAPAEAARESDEGLAAAFRALNREYARYVVAWEQERRVVECRARLTEAVEGRLSADHARLFLHSSQPKLGGRRPIDYCVDEGTLSTCIGLLEPVRRRR